MNRGVSKAFMVRLEGNWRFCVSTRNVRNIWNISNSENKNQQIQRIAGETLFQSNRNTLEQTGTNLFWHVPAIPRKPEHFKIASSPSATRVTAIHPEQMFRHVPVWWNIDQCPASPERRGFQHFASMHVPDVPDVLTPYADSYFLPLLQEPIKR